MLERVIVAGFGGQGVVFLGKLLAQAMMDEGRNVTYFPAYGPEVRGGRANCHVIISTEPILCPIVLRPETLLIMNQVSWDYFAPILKEDGLAVVNASLVDAEANASAQQLLGVPATEIANGLGDVRATNMVMLGAYNHVRGLLPTERLLEHLRAALGGAKAALFELNRNAVLRGTEAAGGAAAGRR